jgi:TPR repeat protein
MGPREARPISANHSLNLSDREVVKMTNRANKGDGDAALRLYMHYAFAQSDSHTGIYWLEKAAESGNETAKHNLRVLALEWPDGIPARTPSPADGTANGEEGGTQDEAPINVIDYWTDP